jgi:hypothetical protein
MQWSFFGCSVTCRPHRLSSPDLISELLCYSKGTHANHREMWSHHLSICSCKPFLYSGWWYQDSNIPLWQMLGFPGGLSTSQVPNGSLSTSMRFFCLHVHVEAVGLSTYGTLNQCSPQVKFKVWQESVVWPHQTFGFSLFPTSKEILYWRLVGPLCRYYYYVAEL